MKCVLWACVIYRDFIREENDKLMCGWGGGVCEYKVQEEEGRENKQLKA